MPDEILSITTHFMRNPVRILVKKDELTLEGIKQFYIMVEKEEWKLDTLCDLYETLSVTQAIIYCNSRRKVDWLTDKMTERQFTVSAMHGEMTPQDRENIMKQFRLANHEHPDTASHTHHISPSIILCHHRRPHASSFLLLTHRASFFVLLI